jgi:hypothetical protein
LYKNQPDHPARRCFTVYDLASARFGYSMDKVQKCQAFHFKCGQGAKTGAGGHLPGNKVWFSCKSDWGDPCSAQGVTNEYICWKFLLVIQVALFVQFLDKTSSS